jgi:Mad3/BUB1 homology region 1
MNEEGRGEGSLLFQATNAGSTSSVKKQQTYEWELMKENTAPLARGRSIPTLGNNNIVIDELQRTIDQFEAQIGLSSTRRDEDPLVIWLSYIKFLQESAHPSKTNQATPVFSLLERCVQTFCVQFRYANDPRFIRICCLYADQTKEPLTTFQQMHQPPYRIGTESAVFFNAWAFVAEKMQFFTVAEQIFRQGLATNVQPVTYLQIRHARFQKRMSRHWLNASLQGGEGDDEETSLSTHLRQRTIFGSLSSSTTHRSVALPSSSQPLFPTNAPMPRSNSNPPQIPTTASFVIASDDPEQLFLSHQASATHFSASWKPEAERWKENRGPLQQWNAFGALTSAYDQEQPSSSSLISTTAPITRPSSAHASATAVAFDIHVDEDCAPPPSQQLEHRHRAARDDRVHAKNSKDDAKQSRPSKPMWKHRLLSNPVTKEEQSFEQARFQAGAFTLVAHSHNINLLRLSSDDDEEEVDRDMSMSMEELMSEHEASFTGSITEVSLTADPLRFMNSSATSTPLPNSLPHNTSIGSTQGQPNSLNRMLLNNEPTINTQWALRELSFMFASPAAAVPAATVGEARTTHQSNPEEECDTNPTFAIFCDPEDDERKVSSYKIGNQRPIHHPEPSFAIFCDDPEETQRNDVISPS